MDDPDLVKFYRERIDRHGLGYAAMWGDDAAWKSDERFRPMLTLPIKTGDVVVDIGCGTGDLAHFLERSGLDVRYIGVEAVPEFAAQARSATRGEILELDAFKAVGDIPNGDWLVTFGTLNKVWSVTDLEGSDPPAKVVGLLQRLFGRARKGIACSLVTDRVDFRKDGVINMSPSALASELSRLAPHFTLYHGYPFYEFFAAAWRGERR